VPGRAEPQQPYHQPPTYPGPQPPPRKPWSSGKILAVIGSVFGTILLVGCCAIAVFAPGERDNTAPSITRTTESATGAVGQPETTTAEPAPAPTTAAVPVPTAAAPAPPKPTTKKPTAPRTSSRGNCDPAYPTVCIPPGPPDLDCGDIPFRRFKVLPPDPHRLDGNDNDGIGCET